MQPNTNTSTNNEREHTASAIPRKFLARICATSGTLPNLSVLWLVCLHQDLRRWHHPTLMAWCSNIYSSCCCARPNAKEVNECGKGVCPVDGTVHASHTTEARKQQSQGYELVCHTPNGPVEVGPHCNKNA
jgi:hypothetical protein